MFRLWNLELEKRKLRKQEVEMNSLQGTIEMSSYSVDMHQNVKVERGSPEGVAIQD
jgi:hypothetical protein